jgi:dipeptidyl aminopeptidase/acylaminoacyl peptidase
MRKMDGREGDDRGDTFFDYSLGTDMEKLANDSPVNRIADLKVPVFLVHGEDDKTANINQYQAMLGALRQAGRSPETMVLDGEGHGFYSPAHRAELFERMAAFLDKHIGPDAKQVAGN